MKSVSCNYPTTDKDGVPSISRVGPGGQVHDILYICGQQPSYFFVPDPENLIPFGSIIRNLNFSPIFRCQKHCEGIIGFTGYVSVSSDEYFVWEVMAS